MNFNFCLPALEIFNLDEIWSFNIFILQLEGGMFNIRTSVKWIWSFDRQKLFGCYVTTDWCYIGLQLLHHEIIVWRLTHFQVIVLFLEAGLVLCPHALFFHSFVCLPNWLLQFTQEKILETYFSILFFKCVQFFKKCCWIHTGLAIVLLKHYDS